MVPDLEGQTHLLKFGASRADSPDLWADAAAGTTEEFKIWRAHRKEALWHSDCSNYRQE